MVCLPESHDPFFICDNTLTLKSLYLCDIALVVDGLRRQALDIVSDIEKLSVDGTGLPYRIPRRYNSYVWH